MSIIRWVRAPLSHGGRRATLATAIAVVAAFAVPVSLPVARTLRERLMFSGIGVFSLCLGLLRPRFFWESDLMDGWRGVFGDRPVAILYVAVGIVFVAAPLLA